MKIIAINGSPRKTWNTATLLGNALEGAASEGAVTHLYHLYDIDYKGCTSCFSCKTKGGESYGRCGYIDGLTPVLEEIHNCDGVFLGSPVYLGNVTGQMRSLIERMIFQYLSYGKSALTLREIQIPVGLVYTMNVKEDMIEAMGYKSLFDSNRLMFEKIFGYAENLFCTDTYQFDDYSKYVVERFSEPDKAKRRREVFPEDCRKAYEMGARFVELRKV